MVMGSFIMTTCLLMHHISCRDFWWNIKSPRWLRPLTAQIWHPEIWPFPKLKSPLKGKRFQTIYEIQENRTGKLMILTKYFAECFKQQKRSWKNCVRSQGAYFEGDWDIIVLCTMSLISCVFFIKCLYLFVIMSHCMAGCSLDRPCHMYVSKWPAVSEGGWEESFSLCLS